MYQLNETDMRRGRRRELLEGSGNVLRPSARRNGTSLSDVRVRVVRVPGGFAFVEDRPITDTN